jgi:hypothetical protein
MLSGTVLCVAVLAACGDSSPPPESDSAKLAEAIATPARSLPQPLTEGRADTLYAKSVGVPLDFSISANQGNIGNYTGDHSKLCLQVGYSREELDSLDKAGVDISCGKLQPKGTVSASTVDRLLRTLDSLDARARFAPVSAAQAPAVVDVVETWQGPVPGQKHPRFVKLSLGNFVWDHRTSPGVPVWEVGTATNTVLAEAWLADSARPLASAPIKYVVATPSILAITGNRLQCKKAGLGKFRANWTTASGATVLTRDSTNIRCVAPRSPFHLAPSKST